MEGAEPAKGLLSVTNPRDFLFQGWRTCRNPLHPPKPIQPLFVTTRWSVVLRAGRSDTTRAQSALAELCQAYWYPLYAYARLHGFDPHDAEDAMQGLFEKLLKLRSLAGVEQARGRFRAFLLAR